MIERRSRKRSSSAGSEKWRDLVIDKEKWRGIVRQANPKAGCSANGRRRK
jgi:hypothetical protein